MEPASAEPQNSKTKGASNGAARFNLTRANFLIVDNNLGLDILALILYGFGARSVNRCQTVEDARTIISEQAIDIVILETNLPEESGYEFVNWLRRLPDKDDNRFLPVILLSAHTSATQVKESRDCGASFFIAKPVSAQVLSQRMLWIARENRQFVMADTYIGPDRRFHEKALTLSMVDRRKSDTGAGNVEAEMPATDHVNEELAVEAAA